MNKLYAYECCHKDTTGLFSKLIAKYCISKEFNIDVEDIHFARNAYGKPYVLHKTGVHYNISHSGKWIICGVGPSELGVDIQWMKKTIFREIMHHFFTIEEQKYVTNSYNLKESFYDIWTLKESYIKALGLGMHKALKSFSILPAESRGLLNDSMPQNFNYQLNTRKFKTNYKIATCCSKGAAPHEIECIKKEDVMAFAESNKKQLLS